MAIGIAISVATFTPATWYLSAMYSAIYDGAVTNANGGSILDDLKSAGFSFASASVWHGTGSFLDKINADVGERIAVHGIVGGGLAVAEGGSFSDGFLSAAAGEALPTSKINIGGSYTLTVAARTAAAGVVGGTVAAVSGGNFVNGAKTAAFAELFNDLSHSAANFLVGFGDGVSFGLTAKLRSALGVNGGVDTGSLAYKLGNFFGFLDTAAIGAEFEGAAVVAEEGAPKLIENGVTELERVGSALKTDMYHNFPDVVDNFAHEGSVFQLGNGAKLYQVEGSLNRVLGRFEWITQNEAVTHRMFIKNGTINGIPISP